MFNKHVKCVAVIFLLSVALWQAGSSSVQAQNTIPLVIYSKGQLLRWTPGENAQRPTGCDLKGNVATLFSSSLKLNVTGEWTALMLAPRGYENSAPSVTGNLWVCNINTSKAYALTDRDVELVGTVSQGTFSPDGRRIAWTEKEGADQESMLSTLYVHDLQTQRTRVLTKGLKQADVCGQGGTSPLIAWGTNGIAVGYTIPDPHDPCGDQNTYGFSIYGEDGTRLRTLIVGGQPNFYTFEWLVGTKRLAFGAEATRFNGPLYQLYSTDIDSNQVRAEPFSLEASAPDNGANAAFYSLASPGSDGVLHIHLPGSSEILQTSAQVALAPDGQTLAILIGKTLYLATKERFALAPWSFSLSANQTTSTPATSTLATDPVAIAWAAPSYRLGEAFVDVCPFIKALDTSSPLYVVNGLGINNIRAAPSKSAAVIGPLAEGDQVILFDDGFDNVSVCTSDDLIRWRQVLYKGQIGWTAEAQGGTYFLRN